MLEAIGPEILVQMDDGFGIAMGAKAMAGSFEPMSQLSVVVDFTIENDLYRTVFVAHRLATGVQIDDRQTAKTQPDAGVPRRVEQMVGVLAGRLDPKTFVVGSAMLDRVGHRSQLVDGQSRPMG